MKNECAFQKYSEQQRAKKLRAEGRKKPQVFIFYGESGVQKSPVIYEKHGMTNVFSCPDLTGKWFDGYNGEPVILFDDVKCDAVPTIIMFKRLSDGFPQQFPVKGGFMWFRPDVIYFTSNYAPENWWSCASSEDWVAFCNRVWMTRRLYRDENKAIKTEVVYKNKFYYPEEDEEAGALAP